MKDIEVALNNFSKKDIKIDTFQHAFLKEFINLDSKFKPSSFFLKNKSIGNIYLWGPVGRGKTLMLQMICDSYFVQYGRFHFIEFMQMIHKSLSDFSGINDPLLKVVKKLANKYNIIFIDEFQIEDIADAMIIGMLIESISKNGTRLFLSSNSPPEDLYKDGLQRSKFLKTIDFLNQNFMIYHLLGSEDYRLREIADFDSSAEDVNNNSSVKKFLKKTFSQDISMQKEFFINERKFNCMGVSEKVLWLSFKDFFSSPCSSNDFVKIVKKYEWIFINNFHSCNDDHIDLIRRFISFVDIAYQEKQKLKLFFDPKLIFDLYSGDLLNSLWMRTQSRLHQVGTKKYLQNLEKN
ncbi:MAG: cell division protein ZapE [Gammaproteobacteria bacterium]|nr:cell division protein ZapE [Gammaproteobacteria bacterium]